MKQGIFVVFFVTLLACGGASTVETSPSMDTNPTEVLALDDIGLRNQRLPENGVLTGGAPTENTLELAKKAGVKSILSLRVQTEIGAHASEEKAKALGFDFSRLAVNGAYGVTFENAHDFGAQLERLERPTLVHCGSGNRVGAMAALHAFLKGSTIDEALEIGRRWGLTKLEPTVLRMLESRCHDDQANPLPKPQQCTH